VSVPSVRLYDPLRAHVRAAIRDTRPYETLRPVPYLTLVRPHGARSRFHYELTFEGGALRSVSPIDRPVSVAEYRARAGVPLELGLVEAPCDG
jgi:hypothetical protein